MDFIKIKHDPNSCETTLRWEEIGESGLTDRHELVSKDEPHPDFLAALEALKPVVCTACNIEPTDEERRDHFEDFNEVVAPDKIIDITIRGVTLKDTTGEEGEQVGGATITALRKLPWCSAPLVINTPFAPIETIPDADTEYLIRRLVKEAESFVRGKRMQGDLFAGEEESTPKDNPGGDGSYLRKVTRVAEGKAVLGTMDRELAAEEA